MLTDTTKAIWLCEEKPREKMLKRGAASLSDAELLAIFLRTGISGKNVLLLAEEILEHFGGLRQLFRASEREFCQIKGLGRAKYVQLQASLEMTERFLREEIGESSCFTNPASVKAYLRSRLAPQLNEIFAVLFLDNQHRLLQYEELFFGSINSASVHPRVVVQQALRHNAAAVILCHNHPSAVSEPSHSDLAITEQLRQALGLIEVRLLDHLIVAGNQVTSLAELGVLSPD